MPNAEEIFEAALARVQSAEPINVGQMFGKPCAKVAGKAFMARQGRLIVFKLNGDAHRMALTYDGSSLWDPSGKGRAMREWVAIPEQADADWASLSQSAHDFVFGSRNSA
ncbi:MULTISPECIES: hypothetical protein [unclassified Novosphingobium]|uniref:hypothetical protein n=1 Tax=unclassified Novosphingobium TaxID=2644732 RepID=UPI0025FEC6BC|nr:MULTISPECIES: hypothetical protein [unclassified Novosphingobium]HQV03336.1 hypothetical protein [Novosphingobium sp.]